MPVGLDDMGAGSEVATALLMKDGRFTILNVAAGSYILLAARSTAEYQFYDPASQSKWLPEPPTPQGRPGNVATFGVFSGPVGATLQTVQFSTEPEPFHARVPLTVASDHSDIVVALRRSATMTGKVVWPDDEARPTDPSGLASPRPTLFPAGGNALLGVPRARNDKSVQQEPGRFIVDGLLPGEYVLGLSGPAPGRIRSVTWNGRDYTHRPFDATTGEDITGVVVTMTTKSTLLSGRVVDQRNLPATDSVVIAFPVERDQWTNYGLQPARLKVITTTNTGTYRFQTLPAGEYFVVSATADVIETWQDPVFLEKISRAATRLTLPWGESRTLDLRLVTGK